MDITGDFNLLPPVIPFDSAKMPNYTPMLKTPLNDSLEKYKHAFPDLLSASARTYLPFGSGEPDRKIDYVFYGGPIEIESATVLSEASAISDHLPLEINFRLTTSL